MSNSNQEIRLYKYRTKNFSFSSYLDLYLWKLVKPSAYDNNNADTPRIMKNRIIALHIPNLKYYNNS